MREPAPRRVRLDGDADVAGFRQAARRLLAESVAPSEVVWQIAGQSVDDLFAVDRAEVAAVVDAFSAADATVDAAPSSSSTGSAPVRVPPFFVPLCERAALHADPGRFALLYRLLWRLVREPGLRGDPLDPDRVAAEGMARVVRREMHKMTAFVRFRPIAEVAPLAEAACAEDALATDALPDGSPSDEALAARFDAGDGLPPPAPLGEEFDTRWHVAWFEPAHHVVEATAPFFARRFAQMRWAILTPRCCVRWDGATLAFGPGARRDEAPAADAGEQLWLTYYEHIFNPARLKLGAMKKEMPRRYWPNLPEAVLIQPLTEKAGAVTDEMVDRGGTEMARRRPRAVASAGALGDPASLDTLIALHDATQNCRECPIGAMATQAVPGEGPSRARLMLVGEQPGDQEDLRGRPFVGPAGQLLDKALAQLGWRRDAVFLTNAVRHFKYELRGSRRIHKTPSQREAAACLHWLETEMDLVAPEAAIALGATAARALLGRPVSVTSERGRWLRRADGLPVLITLHPSALLRADPQDRAAAFDRWIEDLRQASPYLDAPAPKAEDPA